MNNKSWLLSWLPTLDTDLLARPIKMEVQFLFDADMLVTCHETQVDLTDLERIQLIQGLMTGVHKIMERWLEAASIRVEDTPEHHALKLSVLLQTKTLTGSALHFTVPKP